ncbi:hypothetical protein [Hymenobacter lucidus]|uniref:Uncharacterized protein n=1 Tax=Hymenobacter lucidus TaxID=2880930 RepID=A0ABS8AN84_9BACT|nr:hypothetical protein [Hymenobacter lucidus]MCB2407667.1 hypothetical protein [Hymenobacter lucidus]
MLHPIRLNIILPFALLATVLLSGCEKDPEEYRLSAEQLAWQPYHANDVLRFGHAKDGKVRTYRVTEVQDQMEKQNTGINWTPFPSRELIAQQVKVLALRTDSTAQPQTVLNLELYYDGSEAKVVLLAEVEWETFYPAARLPIDSVNAGVALGTTFTPGIEFLPTITLGPATYSQVIRAQNQYPTATLPGLKLVRQLYYAKNKGVVAFEEDGTGLWYRLP